MKLRILISHLLGWTIAVLASVCIVASYSAHIGDTATSVLPTKMGFIGDSITRGLPDAPTAVDVEMALLGDKYAAVNRGMGGAATEVWLPGHATYDTTLAYFKIHQVTVVSIMLGTNDARNDIATSPVAYKKNMQAIVQNLLHATGIQRVIINYPPYTVPGSANNFWGDATAARLKAYMVQLNTLIDGKRVFRGDTEAYTYFKDHQNELVDGIHPTPAGYEKLGQLWARAYMETLPRQTSFFRSPSHLL